jgi:type II secretory pathway pseudopilin PulG
MRTFKGQKGLSLVEVTIMLLVLMLLTAVLAPSIFDFVNDAKWVKVKEDCEAIGLSLSRLVRDVGPCLHVTATSGCLMQNRVNVLWSAAGAFASSVPQESLADNIGTKNWDGTGGMSGHNDDTLENQLVFNAPNYPTPQALQPGGSPVGPRFNLGWRGAYLSSPIGPDPWGTKYYVNTGFMAVVANASGGPDGRSDMFWNDDVYCLSAGPNTAIETPFRNGPNFGGNYGTYREGDDFVYVISGSGP